MIGKTDCMCVWGGGGEARREKKKNELPRRRPLSRRGYIIICTCTPENPIRRAHVRRRTTRYYLYPGRLLLYVRIASIATLLPAKFSSPQTARLLRGAFKIRFVSIFSFLFFFNTPIPFTSARKCDFVPLLPAKSACAVRVTYPREQPRQREMETYIHNITIYNTSPLCTVSDSSDLRIYIGFTNVIFFLLLL